jgi:hypothetical protein
MSSSGRRLSSRVFPWCPERGRQVPAPARASGQWYDDIATVLPGLRIHWRELSNHSGRAVAPC